MSLGENTGLVSALAAAASLGVLLVNKEPGPLSKVLAVLAVVLGLVGLLRRDTVPTTRLAVGGLVVGGILLLLTWSD